LFGLFGYGRGRTREAGRQTEQANTKVDEIEMRIQIQLDRTEISQTGEASDGHQGIERSKNQTELPRGIRAFPKSCPKGDYSADEVKYVMRGRKRKIKHFAPKKSRDADYDQDRPAQYDIDFCQRSSHFSLVALPFVRDFIAEFRGAYDSRSYPVKTLEIWLLGKTQALRL
jgi:hypothetical protein